LNGYVESDFFEIYAEISTYPLFVLEQCKLFLKIFPKFIR